MPESILLNNSFQFLVFIFSFITTSFFGNKKNKFLKSKKKSFFFNGITSSPLINVI